MSAAEVAIRERLLVRMIDWFGPDNINTCIASVDELMEDIGISAPRVLKGRDPVRHREYMKRYMAERKQQVNEIEVEQRQ